MNASLGLRLAPQLAFRPCFTARPALPLHRSPLSLLRTSTSPRTIFTSSKFLSPKFLSPRSDTKHPSNVSYTTTRSVSFNRRARPSPRARQAPSLPAPPEPSIAKPATITGAEQEGIRYTDYMRPPGSSSEDPAPAPPPSPTQIAISRYISLFGVIFAVVHLIWWAPNLSAYAHGSSLDLSDNKTKQEFFLRYVAPWRDFTDRWLTFSPAMALSRLGLNPTHDQNYRRFDKSSEASEPFLTKITQFLLPTVSHREIWHLAFNFFALQALSPTIVRYYGFSRALLAYPVIGVLSLALILPVDRLLNPFTHLTSSSAFVRYAETDANLIRQKTNLPATKAQQEEHWLLGQHCRPALGASGVLCGFLAITAIVNPMAKFELMFIPVGISVRTLFMGFVGLDLVGIGLRQETVGNIGHLTGALAGVLVWALWLRRVRLPDEVRRHLMMGLRRRKMGLD